jgi:hypothetical protein
LKSPVCLCSMSAKLNSSRHWPRQLLENSAGDGCVRPPESRGSRLGASGWPGQARTSPAMAWEIVQHDSETKGYRDGAAYCVSSLRMILPPFITNLTR